jgi:type I restriction enzyme S subunit
VWNGLGKYLSIGKCVESKFILEATERMARKNDIQLSATQAYGVIPREYEKRTGKSVVKISMH